MTVNPEPLGPLVLQLNKSTQELTKSVADLADRMDNAEKRTNSIPMIQKITAALAAGALLIGAAVAWAVVQIDQSADHIQTLQDRTSAEVLCPLYGLFIQSINRPLAADSDEDGVVTDAEQEQFDKAVKVIYDGYDVLDCPPLPTS